jgi:hypothetical protein
MVQLSVLLNSSSATVPAEMRVGEFLWHWQFFWLLLRTAARPQAALDGFTGT